MHTLHTWIYTDMAQEQHQERRGIQNYKRRCNHCVITEFFLYIASAGISHQRKKK